MITRLHRWALCPLALLCTISSLISAENYPAPSPEQGVTFSHVYKIDIPGSSSCKVESLPFQEQASALQTGSEATIDGENNIVFRHNIRLQTPKCDCEESESFKSLLYRVNGLEEEVNYLKTQCAQGCCSKTGGVDTSCSGHGTYNHDACSCVCDPGWEGPDCSVSSCPDECNDNGRCVDGRCVCHQGYTGDDCSQLLCPDNCNDKGHCVDGKCVCFPHFTGEDCSIQRCPNDCIGNGRCVDGQCICDEGFFGDDCSLVLGPKGLRLVRVTDVSLLVEWESVRGAEYYVLTYHPKGDEGALERVRVPNTESSYLMTGLTPGVTYIVHVYAVIREIQSEADKIEATTVVSAIDGIRVLGQTEDSIQVDWKNPATEVDHFRLTHTDPTGQQEEEDIQISQEARTTHTIVGLYPGTEYQISVQAIKATHEGKASTVTGVTDMDAPTNLVAIEVTEDTARVTWDRVQADIDGYMLSYSSAEGSSGDIPVGSDISSYRLVGLRPGVLYTVYIWAFKGERTSRKTSTEVETELDAPTNLFTRDETESSFSVSWDRVQADNDGYMLSYSSAEGSSGEISVGSDSSSYRLTGLSPGLLYTVYVWAVKGSKTSSKSTTQAETELDAPTNLLTRDETESSFSVSWDRVQADIDGYMLSYSSAEGSSLEIPVGSDSSSYRLTGLRPGVHYTVHVWAVKGSKDSRKSCTEAETELDAPTNLLTRDETESSFSVSWDRVQAEIDGYMLSYSSAEASSGEISVSSDSSSYRLTGLRPGVLCTVYIWAVKGSKASKRSSTEAETELDAPTNLLTRNETESSFSVSWDRVQAEIDGYMLSYSSAEGSSGEIPVGSDSSSYRLTGLRPGVLYTVYIWAVKGYKTSRKSSTEAETELDAPTNLLTRDETESSFSVSWDRVQADIDGYMLSYSSAEGSSVEIPVGSDSSSYRLTGLRPGVLYTVYIWAVKGSKASSKSSTEAETELDAPTNLLTRDETESSFSVSWGRVQADIDGYMLSYSSAEGSSGEISVSSDSSSYRLTGLRPGVLYTVYVWAVKGSKASSKSSTEADTELDAPTNLLTRDETESSFSVSWDRVQAEIDGYMLSYSSAEASSGEISVSSDSSSYRLTGLRPGVLCTVYIWAVKGSKASKRSSTEAETELDAPTNLLTRNETESSFSVSWDRVQAEIDGYMLSYSSAEGSSGEIPVGSDSSSYRLTGLRPGVLYTVYIWAVKGYKTSRKSSTEAETELDAPTNLLTRDETESSFSVSWDRVQADIDGYMLSYSSAEGSSVEIPVGSDNSSYRLTGLRPGVLYTVYIWAVKGSKASSKSSTEAETELDAPTNLLTRDETESSFSVSWGRVQADIDGYMLSYSSAEGSSGEISVSSDSSSYRLTGLRPGVLYTVYVWAVKGSKASSKSSTEADTELDAPTNLLTRDETESSFSVSWDRVHADIDGYMLSYSSAEGSSLEIPVGSDSSSYRLTGLRPGVLYTVYIWAVKGYKASRKSSTGAETELDAPTNLLTRDETESSFSVSWDRVQADIDGYLLSYSSAEGSSVELFVSSDSSSYRLTGLKPGVLYTVYIWAVKGSKASSKSSTEAETELDAPTNLLTRDETESSFSVSWDRVQADIDGYMLSYSSAEGSSGEIPVGSDSSSYRLTGLRPGVLYTVYIWAIKGSKASSKSSTEAETELDAPTNLLTRDETESSFSVSWDRVHAEIDGYMLSYSSADGSSVEISVGSDSSSYMLTGLRPGVLYTVYIWAVKGSKASRKSSTEAETEIDAPKDLKATDVTLDSATVTWIPPLADIEGYILTYRPEDGSMETTERQLGARGRRFALSGLEMGKGYIVTLIAYRGAKRSKVVETIFKTVGLLYPFPMDCIQLMRNGNTRSGIYTIYINNNRSKPIEVFCDMDTDGGGWLVLQRRTIGRLDFMKRWRQYIAGFGDLTEEFWLGLDKIYELTNTPTQYELRFDLGYGSERAYAIYDNFKIAPSRQKFKLTIGKYRGTAGDAMTYHQGRPWSTVDSDNDIALGNCALTHRGAWWYKNCHLANLNGKWGDTRHSMGVNWEPWKGHLMSLDFTEMKIRPVGALSSRKRRSLMAREKSRNKTNPEGKK